MAKDREKDIKTNAMRILDQNQIEYDTGQYEYDESDLSGNHAAAVLGISEDEIFKTLVTRSNTKELFVFVIPVSGELDLKKAAAAAGQKKVEMIHVKELVGLTGYMRGGCSPIGMKKLFPTVFHSSVENLPTVIVSAGKIGYQVEVKPADLMGLVRAETADIIVEN